MVINDAQIHYSKPEMMGGGGNSFDGISDEHIHSAEPENGTYEISGSGNLVTVEGTSVNKNILSATPTMNADGMDISWLEPD